MTALLTDDRFRRRTHACARFIAAAILLLPAACTERATSAVAARNGDHTLSADRLAQILVLGQPLPLTRSVANEMAHHWLNLSAIAERVAAGDSLMESDLVNEATWLERRGRLVETWFRARSPEPLRAAERIADSVYAAGHTRLFAHIFRRIGPEMRPDEKQLQRETAERIHGRLLAGGAWNTALAESEDANTRGNNGLLGLIRPGDLVPEFERAAFALQPGQLSPVVETRFGYHIIHRPRLNEVRATFTRLLAQEMAGRADSATASQLAQRSHLSLAVDAPGIVRKIGDDPWSWLSNDGPLATFDGGVFTAGALARYLVHLPTDAREGLAMADDDQVRDFIRPMILDELIIRRAAGDGIALPDSIEQALRNSYREALAALLRDARLDAAGLADMTVAAGDDAAAAARLDQAAAHVEEYMDAIAARRLELRPVPPLLAARLLAGRDAGVRADGIAAALTRAERLIAAAGDTARASSSRDQP